MSRLVLNVLYVQRDSVVSLLSQGSLTGRRRVFSRLISRVTCAIILRDISTLPGHDAEFFRSRHDL